MPKKQKQPALEQALSQIEPKQQKPRKNAPRAASTKASGTTSASPKTSSAQPSEDENQTDTTNDKNNEATLAELGDELIRLEDSLAHAKNHLKTVETERDNLKRQHQFYLDRYATIIAQFKLETNTIIEAQAKIIQERLEQVKEFMSASERANVLEAVIFDNLNAMRAFTTSLNRLSSPVVIVINDTQKAPSTPDPILATTPV